MAPKVVVITGCSTGIGLDTAVLLASDKEGRFKVFATMRNLAKQDRLKTAAGDMLDKTLFIRELDVTNEESIVGFLEKIDGDEGGVDILVNNAGTGQTGNVENVTMEQVRRTFEINVFGLIRLTQGVIPGMKAKKSGHIINVSSLGGAIAMPFFDVYSSSKFAVKGLSESIAPLLKNFNVHVSVIEPGPVDTAFVENISTNKLGEFGKLLGSDDVDELTQQLYQKYMETLMSTLGSSLQTGKDIATVIQEAILADKPHFVYQTSEATRKAVAKKFKDPTGDDVVNRIARQSGWS